MHLLFSADKSAAVSIYNNGASRVQYDIFFLFFLITISLKWSLALTEQCFISSSAYLTYSLISRPFQSSMIRPSSEPRNNFQSLMAQKN
jgi:hypothetical protein